MCGFSGLPKLRQLVRPSGSAPTQARLAAHSSTASTAPRYGSQATRRPLPSIETAIARAVGRARSTAASACSGRRTVRDCTTQSYCSNTGRREAMLARAQQREQDLAAGRRRSSARGGRRVERRGRLGRREVVERAVVDERRAPACRRPASPPLEHAQAAAVGDLADRASRCTSHFSQTASTSSTRVGLDDAQHPLLRLGDHDLERLHARLAQRHAVDVDVEPDARPWSPSPTEDEVRPGGAEVLQRDEQPAVEQLQRSTRAASSPRTGRRSAPSGAWRRRPRRARRWPAPRRRRSRRGRSARRTARATLPDAGGGARGSAGRARASPSAHRVDQAVLLVGTLEVDLAADRRHADRVAVVADAGDRALEQVARARGLSSSPKRSESSTAIGRAPTAKTSRRMPPTPVAAPWNGSTALGWLCDSTLNAIARPPPTSTAPAFSPGPISTCGPSVGSWPQQLLRVLVGAVLGPHQREHRQLDVVRLAAELLDDQRRTRRR